MSRNTTKPLSRSLRLTPSAPNIPTPRPFPYVCANCAATRTPKTSQPSRNPSLLLRPFTTTTSPHRQQAAAAAANPKAPPQSHYDFFPQTFPSGGPPHASFTPDLRQLRREFLQLQAKAHPDVAAAGQKRAAEALSTRINEAYKTLREPLGRARYLLAQHGIDVEDETARLGEEPGLLMEVMEAREAVDEVAEEEELGGLREENGARIEASVRVLEDAFGEGDLQRAAKEAIRLRYWMNIDESIQGWEKGKGGGLIHH